MTVNHFVHDIVKSKEINTLYEEHTKYYGELLIHVFLGDLARIVIKNPSEYLDVMKIVENALKNGDSVLQEAIITSFLETVVNILSDSTAEHFEVEINEILKNTQNETYDSLNSILVECGYNMNRFYKRS